MENMMTGYTRRDRKTTCVDQGLDKSKWYGAIPVWQMPQYVHALFFNSKVYLLKNLQEINLNSFLSIVTDGTKNCDRRRDTTLKLVKAYDDCK